MRDDYGSIGIKPVQSFGQNYVASAQLGLERERMNNEQARLQREEVRKNATYALYKLAAAGDPQATKQLSIANPEAYTGLQHYQLYQTKRGGQLAQGVIETDAPYRPKAYENAIISYTKEFGEAPPVPREYSEEALQHLKQIVAQAREVEDVAKQQFEMPKRDADIANTKARTTTEGYQQRNYAANIGKTTAEVGKLGLESEKLGEEIGTLRTDREAMKAAGFTSPTAYKKYQETLGESVSSARISLPKVEAQANNAIKLIDDIVNHKGMSSSVGMKNVLSGAVVKYIPFKDSSIEGSQAANFESKLKQLQGQNFLQAFESLKGGGAISEIEGNKATQAISDMSTSQSEKEFKKSAEQLKSIIKSGVERAKKQGGLIPQTPAQNSQPSIPRVGEVQSGYQFTGGDPASPSSWRKL